MNRSSVEPLLLLFVFGGAMGSIIALAKFILGLGGHPLVLAFHQFAISGAVLLGVSWARGVRVPVSAVHLTFYGVSSMLGVAGPHVLLFLVVPRLGAGFSSIAFIFPPLFTYLMALVVRMEGFHGVRALGLMVGLLGSAWIMYAAGSLETEAGIFWIAALYLIPFIVAWGNIYRALHWPSGLGNLEVTTAVLATSAALLLIPAVFAAPSQILFQQPSFANLLTLLQAFITGAAYLVFFRLQTVGGPVYLSQAGYIITGTGMFYGLLLFKESYLPSVWIGFAVSVLGVVVVTIHQAVSSHKISRSQSPSP